MATTPLRAAARMLGIAGGSVSLASIFLPWLSVLNGLITVSLVQMFNLPEEWRNAGVAQVAGYEVTGTALLVGTLALLVVGGLASFRTPKGGALVVVAAILFAVGFNLYLPVGLFIGLGLGFFLALAGGVIALIGIPLQRPMAFHPPPPPAAPQVIYVQASPPQAQVVELEPPPPPPP